MDVQVHCGSRPASADRIPAGPGAAATFGRRCS